MIDRGGKGEEMYMREDEHLQHFSSDVHSAFLPLSIPKFNNLRARAFQISIRLH
jgi:hypothetical protein